MALKLYRPLNPGIRHASVIREPLLTKERPEKSLTVFRKKRSGRNSSGKITVRHRGGGARRYVRLVDFKGDKFDITAKVKSLEYDPNRSAYIALLQYVDGEKRYVLAPAGLAVGQTVVSSRNKGEIQTGNRLLLKNIPTGTSVFNVELNPGQGGQMCRSAGNYAIINSFDAGMAQLKFPSGEIRLLSENCLATIGAVSNPDWRNVRWGKAGRMRHRGIKPTVRGKAMNPVDHPHGGGEGKHPIGMKHPKTYTGKIALGVKTRKLRKFSNQFIIQRRKGKLK